MLDRLGVVGALEAAGAAPLPGTRVTAARGAGSMAASRWPAVAVPADRALALPPDPRPRLVAPRAPPVRRCSSARRSRSCCTRRRSGGRGGPRRRTAAAGRLRPGSPSAPTASARSSPAGSAAGATAVPAASRSWRTWTASRAWGTRPRCTSAGAGTSDSTRSAAGAPTWPWWCPQRRRRGPRPDGGFFLEALRASPALSAGRAGAAGAARARHRTVRRAVRPGHRRRRGARGRRRRLLRSLHRRRDLQRAPRRRAAGRGGGRGAGAAGAGHGRAARALSPRPAPGVRRQVGGRAADRLRHAVPRPVRPRGRPARRAAAWRTP